MSYLGLQGSDDPAPRSAGPLRRLLSHRWLFLIVFAGTFAVTTTLVFLLPTKYESEMKLLVSNERPDLVISPKDDKESPVPEELAEIRINSEIELLRSHDVLKQVVLKADLSHEPGTVAASGAASPVSLDRSVRSLQRHLEITPVKKSEIITVAYRAKSPEVANAVLKNLADTYLGMHLTAHTNPGSFKFFNDQANACAERLARSEEQLRLFRQQHASLVQPDEKDALTQRVMEAQAALESADAQEAEYRNRVREALHILPDMDSRVTQQVRTSPQTALIAQLSSMLAELQNRRTEMVTKFRPDDRLVVELDNEIASTKATLNKATADTATEQVTDLNQVRVEAEKSLSESRVSLAGAKARRGRLESMVADYKKRMFSFAGAATENDRLIRQVKEDEDNYLLYSKKREEARIAESLDQQRITNVSLVQAPTLPVDPVSPQVPLDLAVGFLFSGFLAFLTVRLRDHLLPVGALAYQQAYMPAPDRIAPEFAAD
jgi:succinoglycan biosynthesis transport protein ExoP